jgi:LmbE family N-acetylglucosaminyl deacetylase
MRIIMAWHPSMLITLMLTSSLLAPSASPDQPQPGRIALDLRNLSGAGSVLYVAAHPDDENTRLLAYLEGRGVRAGYLSITRGDGGQNLIGTEQGELLGLIRTHELLAARSIDGAEQMFTRARDFGYSKSAEESLRIWGKDAVLGDVVLAIRRFRPDVIITRFTTEPPNHGHHTASALLAAEAFTAAADPTKYPEQLRPLAEGGAGVSVWQADRLLHNVSTWNLKPDADLSKHIALDVGSYEPLLGASWGEVAALSRSQHKSQGFGVAADRGPLMEYFTPLARAPGRPALVAGVAPGAAKDIFEGLALDASRIKGSAPVVKALEAAVSGFDVRAPHASIPALLAVHAAVSSLPIATDDDAISTRHWRARKLADVERLLVACAGLHLDARAPHGELVPGSETSIDLNALLRAPVNVKLVGVTVGSKGSSQLVTGGDLVMHKPWKAKSTVVVADDARISTPAWIAGAPALTAARANEPVDEAPLTARFRVTFSSPTGGATVEIERPITHVWVDPVRGELSRVVEIAPAITATFARDVVMVPNGAAQDVAVTLVAGRDKASGTLRLEVPAGWRVDPPTAPVSLAARNDERSLSFRITPPKGAAGQTRGVVRALLDDKPAFAVTRIAHDHVPPLAVRKEARVDLVPLALKIGGKRVGYIPGPGDKVAESLAAVGYEVTQLPDARLASMTNAELARFDAIVVGVRAFNAEPRLATHREKLLAYVAGGGHIVVQYNTSSRVGPLMVAPWPHPLEISRDRVTDETAVITRLAPKDALWSKPNAIVDGDFDGWIQERGLYFANKWDAAYTPMMSMTDAGAGEKASEGALLVAKHGKGTFIYTGLAFFRQLPAGVPGAYRLFANVVAR